MIRKIGISILLIGALICLGFLREFIFVNTNSILYSKLYNEHYAFNGLFSFLNKHSYYFVYTSKWFFTAAFIGLYYYLQILVIKWLLNADNIKRWLFLFYVFLVILSIITFGVGWIVGSLNGGYLFSRLFLGILQSPLPIMFLIPVHYFTKKLKQ